MELNIEHKPAAHCENGTISTLLRFYGIDLSEPMIFGLASGLFFSHMAFVKLGGMAVTSFRTFPGVLFKRITKLLGIGIETHRYLNKEKAMNELDRLLLEQHIPVGCVVGMYYLPYIPIEFRFHFNGHNICIIGKDEKSGNYSVLDTNATQKVYISRKDLTKVRFAKGGVYPVLGQMYWITSVPKQLPDLKPLILQSIKKTCKHMVFQPWYINFAGSKGIMLLSRKIRTWEKNMGRKRAAQNLAQVVRMLEEIGTGGAGFRFIYGAFLQEAAKRTGIEELNDFAMRITAIGDLWREFSRKASKVFKTRTGKQFTYDDLGDLLQKIGKHEDAFFHDLDYAVDKYIRQR